MCGMNGYILNNTATNHALINRVNSLIKHCDSYDSLEFIYLIDNRYFSMGMTRHSIIGLASGSQPMFSQMVCTKLKV
jgi:asparagine synthetase B (glutamine-hydrolysing)